MGRKQTYRFASGRSNMAVDAFCRMDCVLMRYLQKQFSDRLRLVTELGVVVYFFVRDKFDVAPKLSESVDIPG